MAPVSHKPCYGNGMGERKRREDISACTYTYVCSNHFVDDEPTKEALLQKTLTRSANARTDEDDDIGGKNGVVDDDAIPSTSITENVTPAFRFAPTRDSDVTQVSSMSI